MKNWATWATTSLYLLVVYRLVVVAQVVAEWWPMVAQAILHRS